MRYKFFNEVNAVDKYEYKLKTEQMLELMKDGAYSKAADIADMIDWRRVRNATMLVQVSDIYEKIENYQKSYDVLSIAYHRAKGSRKITGRLCTLALKTGNIDKAVNYYDEFVQMAPKDPNRHILRYQILRAQNAPVEKQIEALEEYKKSEYTEEWAYELAKLYQEAGMTAECVEECDDLILWFSEGKYVYKAMELKMQYKQLTPQQQEKYRHRFEKPSLTTEEMPDLQTYVEEKETREKDNIIIEETAEEELNGRESEEAESKDSAKGEENPANSMTDEKEADDPTAEKKPLGDLMPLDEALRKLLHQEKAEEQQDGEPDMSDLEGAIEEIEAVADLKMADIAARKARTGKSSTVPGEMKEILPPEDILPEEDETADNEPGTAQAEESGAAPEEQTSADDDQIAGQMSFEDILSGWEQQAAASEEADTAEAEQDGSALLIEEAEEFIENTEKEELPEEESITAEEAEELPEDEEIIEEEAEGLPEDEEIIEEEAEELPEDEEVIEEEAEELPEDEEIIEEEAEKLSEEEETEDISKEAKELPEGDEVMPDKQNDAIKEKKKAEPILPPDIQRMIDEIEGVVPAEEEKEQPEKSVKKEEPHENMGRVTEELRLDDLDDFLDDEYFDEEEEYFDDEEPYDDEEEEYFDEDEEEYLDDEDDIEEYFEDDIEEYFDDETEEEYYDEEEDIPDDDEEYYSEDDEDDDDRPDLEEEFRVNPQQSDEPDDREIPDEDDGMNILSATTPLSRKETAKLIATGKTSPLPLTEISDALSISDTGFVVHGRYDLEMQSGIGTRAGLTEEQKKLFSYFVPVRGMSEQLVDVLEQDKNCTNRGGTSRTGNLLIIGNKGSGKTVLAVDVVKAIQKQRNIRQGKVAIVTGDSLNKKKIGDIFEKIHGGALIIEKAGRMDEKTVARLNKAMEKDTGEILVVLEEQRKPLDRLLSSNREFRRKFTARLEVPVFINDELVTFGQTYAQENGYRIDEMGILALYSKIDSLQREDHAVTVAEVKEIMDKAIAHSQKASAKKLVKRVFGKNTDDADRIFLTEKDFNI